MEILEFLKYFGFLIVLVVDFFYLFIRYLISVFKNPSDKSLQKKKLKLEKKLNKLLEEVNKLYGSDENNKKTN